MSNPLENTYQIKNDNIVSEQFEGEIVVLDLESGFYFGLNPTAAQLWPYITGGYSLSSLQNTIAGLEEFINSLLEHNLLALSDTAPKNDAIIASFEQPEPPQMEVFSDLSDLFKADPIHDVDIGLGWPHVQK